MAHKSSDLTIGATACLLGWLALVDACYDFIKKAGAMPRLL